MLVLSRKQDQEVVIGDNIKITVLKIKGNTIRLGIDAPRDVRIVRGELPLENEGNLDTPGLAKDANVTVVFNNDVAGGGSKVDVIPFRNADLEKRDTRKHLPVSRPIEDRSAATNPQAISFREQLPKALHHNRLKELVKELTRDKN